MFPSKQLRYRKQESAIQQAPPDMSKGYSMHSQFDAVSDFGRFQDNFSQSDSTSVAAKSQQAARRKNKKSQPRNMLDQLIFEEAGACALDFKKTIEKEQKKLKKSLSRSKSKLSSSLADSVREQQASAQGQINHFEKSSNETNSSLAIQQQKISMISRDQGGL